jgi:hypothetical protein
MLEGLGKKNVAAQYMVLSRLVVFVALLQAFCSLPWTAILISFHALHIRPKLFALFSAG